MKKLLVGVALMAFAALINPAASYAETGEQVRSFDSQVKISHDNTVKVVETIVYDLYTNSRHGIYRDVPIDYHDGQDVYYVNFKLIGVWDESGNPLQTELSTISGNKRIRVGDPDTTITGVHTYQVSYELSPLITQRDGRPFLNLDIVGEGWQVPIYNISANVTLEDDAQLQDITWYGASNHSSEPSKLVATGVGAYQGVTINAQLPDGYVKDYLMPNTLRTEDVWALIIGVVVATLASIVAIGIVVILLARSIRTHRRRKSQTVIAEYEPPTGLSPAHIGLLQDDVAEGREITATVIDWAVRGYIKIAYLPKEGIFGRKDYELISLKKTSGLPSSEVALFDAFFGDDKSVKLTKLDKSAVASQIGIFKKALKTQLTDKGYYDKAGQIFMRGTLTEVGAKQWAKVDGFRLYLSVVEKDRLDFSDAPAKTPERFNALLPYAIALGVEKEWAKQFEGIDLQETTNWYGGNFATFSAVTLASDLGSSFASTVSSNSSVSSGGGSAGGGFGGGGGGSW